MNAPVAVSPRRPPTARIAADLMVPVDPALRPEMSLREALRLLGSAADPEGFVIDSEGRPLGMLSAWDIVECGEGGRPAWANGRPEDGYLDKTSVIALTRPDLHTTAPDVPIELLRDYMARRAVRKVLVCEGTRILGQVVRDRVIEEG